MCVWKVEWACVRVVCVVWRVEWVCVCVIDQSAHV